MNKFNFWRTLKLGNFRTGSELLEALNQAGCEFDGNCQFALRQPDFEVSAVETEVKLVVLSLRDLGFRDDAIRSDVYKRARKLGFELCPCEVGPQLRLQYKDQPMEESLEIAMEPIAHDCNFSVSLSADENNGKPALRACSNAHNSWWCDIDELWVFILPK